MAFSVAKAVVCLTLVCVTQGNHMLELYKKWYKGDGTYYGKGGDIHGSCQLNPTPPIGESPKITSYVAMNQDHYYASAACGMCLKFKGSGKGSGTDPIVGPGVVYVKDKMGGKSGDLDFFIDGDGRWEIEYQAVQCPVGQTGLQYWFQGSDGWYLKVQTRNERLVIMGVRLYQPTLKEWTPMKRSVDGFWLLDTAHKWVKPLVPPFQVELTAVNGQAIRDVIPKLENDVAITGEGKQFPLDPNLPSA